MAWNDSGNGNKNPWDRNSGPDGPPDLDKIIRDFQKKFGGMLGGKKPGSAGKGGDAGLPLFAVLGVLLVVWGLTGLYQVDAAERGVVQRFGAYSGTTTSGLRWHLPWPIETVDKVNVFEVNKFNQKTSMLTADENIILIDMTVQYVKTDPLSYLFDVALPDETLADASESAIREVIGRNTMEYTLNENLTEIAEQTKVVIQEALDEYKAGIIVEQVALENADFPPEIKAAVEDAIKAREDKVRLEFEAESYANDIVPKARGAAVRQIQDAEAYKERVMADAQGEAARFTALLVEYKKAPRVTRDRLYLDAIEDVYASSSKVLLDAQGSGNLLYLPIDKLINSEGSSRSQSRQSNSSDPEQIRAGDRPPVDADPRSRGSR